MFESCVACRCLAGDEMVALDRDLVPVIRHDELEAARDGQPAIQIFRGILQEQAVQLIAAVDPDRAVRQLSRGTVHHESLVRRPVRARIGAVRRRHAGRQGEIQDIVFVPVAQPKLVMPVQAIVQAGGRADLAGLVRLETGRHLLPGRNRRAVGVEIGVRRGLEPAGRAQRVPPLAEGQVRRQVEAQPVGQDGMHRRGQEDPVPVVVNCPSSNCSGPASDR